MKKEIKKLDIVSDSGNQSQDIEEIVSKISNMSVSEISSHAEPEPIIKKLNKGEVGEIFVVKQLFNLAKDNDTKKLVAIFGKDADSGITLCDMETKAAISNIKNIKKSKSTQKADCLIKLNKTEEFLYISIKCGHGGMATILNHTPRSAKVFQTDGCLALQLPELDKIIKILNVKRSAQEVTEDIQIKNILLSDDAKYCIINVIKYFMFNGTGSRESKFPCNSMLEIADPNDINKWKFHLCNTDDAKQKYVLSVYDKLILSLRNKGMPKSKNTLCVPWIYKDGTKEKGSLHIRLKK